MSGNKLAKQDALEIIDKQKKTAISVGSIANDHLDKNFIGRLQTLGASWRFVLSWILLASLIVWVLAIQTRSLKNHYTVVTPRDGGTYVEGMLGPLTNINPLYASTPADQAISRMVFSGLFKYDENNSLVGDLASSIIADDKASTFTVTLRDDLKWHDGTALDSGDVLFTVDTIKDPQARSPLRVSWDQIEVEALDAKTLVFRLPGSFSPFQTLLTFGVLPEHVLRDVSTTNLRGSTFNSSEAVGSGPFKLQRIVTVSGSGSDNREQKVQLIANREYHLSSPRLDAFTFWIAPDRDRLTELFTKGELNGASDINIDLIDTESLGVEERVFSLTSGVYLFYKLSNPLLADVGLRTALSQSIDRAAAARSLDLPVQTIRGPLLPEQIGYSEDTVQVAYSRESAEAGLNELGWLLGDDGIRTKEGERLEFLITTQRDTDYHLLADDIAAQLRSVGVDASIDLRDASGFTENVLQNHVYSDMLLYGINIGSDPDVYSFWHSSQADPNSIVRLNLSEYESPIADEALEGGRSRVDPIVRADKYADFLSAWVADVPALGLYRPQFVYYELLDINGPAGTILVSQVDRFRDVANWTVLTDRVPYSESLDPAI